MTSGSLRLFLAASLPNDHLEWVADRTAELRERWPEARWTPRDNQHITLKFLGSTPPDRLEEVSSVCREVALKHAPGPVALAELGVFPSPKRSRVLWIGLDDPGALLTRLARGLDDELASAGFEPEKRTFSAHLTIARFRAPVPIDHLPPLSLNPGPFLLASFDLWLSHLSPKGARYECLSSFALVG